MTKRAFILLVATASTTAGCGDVLAPPAAPLFAVPLEVEGRPIGDAFVDTGGGYELMLKEAFGLELVDVIDVLAYRGLEEVYVTEGFSYSVGGHDTFARFALVGLSICDCNAVGYHFFRETGVVLGLDFSTRQTSFNADIPPGATTIPFHPPPAGLADFESAFIEVTVTAGGESRRLLGVLDTGATITVILRDLFPPTGAVDPNRREVTIAHPALGTVQATLSVFDTPGLPDLILGTDVMQTWANRWYFDFSAGGGVVGVLREPQPTIPPDPMPQASTGPSLGR